MCKFTEKEVISMSNGILKRLLIDRKVLCEMLGGVSMSHIIRLEQAGNLAKARIQVGPRLVRYDLKLVQQLIDSRKLY